MLIDPVTVIAQVINFAILLVALKVLLFDRVVRAMDERERRIADQIASAETRERDAQGRAAELDRRLADLQRTREELLAAARDDARRERDALVARARDEVAEQQERWRVAVEKEEDRLVERLRREAGEEVVAATGRVLADLADARLEDRVVETFLGHLRSLDRDAVGRLRGWAAADQDGWVVASAFDLAPDGRARIREVLAGPDGRAPDVRFDRDPGLVCGVEIRAGGHATGWSVERHLDAFRGTLESALTTGAEADHGRAG